MKYFIPALLLVALTAANASAVVTSSFSQVNPADPSGYVSNAWDVNTGSDDWLSAQLLVQLSSGDIYQNTGVGGSSNTPPDPADFSGNAALEYDSYMTAGADFYGSDPTEIGTASDIGGATTTPPAAPPSLVFNTALIDASWVPPGGSLPPGVLMLGRVTLSDDAQGIYSYRIGADNGATETFTSGFIANGIMQGPVLTASFGHDTGFAGHVSNTFDVDTLGANLLSVELLVDLLSSDDIYQTTDGGGNNTPPNSSQFGTYPHLQYDSYMTAGADVFGSDPTEIGTASDIGGAQTIPPATPPSLVFDTSSIDAAWVPPGASKPSGAMMLARVTLTDDAQGTFKFRIALEGVEPIIFLGGGVVNGRMLFTPPRPGDADFDGDVDADDAAILASFWQQAATGPGQGDFDGDGDADDVDATIMATNWTGPMAAASAAVPEPSTISLLLLLGVLGLGMRRRR